MSEPFDFDQPLTDEDGELDPDALVDYAYELVALFLDAPEGAPFDDEDLDAAESTIYELVERGLREHGLRPSQLTAATLEKILFEGLPRGWRHPAEAASVLEELAAFMRFAGRALGVGGAAECVALLEAEGAQERLASAFRAFNLTCPDPELAAFLREEPAVDDEAPSAAPPKPVRGREEQRQEKAKKKDKKKDKRRNRG